MKRIHQIYAILFVLALATWCLGQDSAISSTPWQVEVQARLDAAGKTAAAANRSIVVTEQPGRYEFVSLDIPPHVFLSFGTGHASREADLVYVGGDNPAKPLITVRGGYSTGIAGCQVRDKTNSRSNLVGIRVDDAINPAIQNIRIDLRGKDTIGLQIAGRESLTISRLESRASVPIQYLWGDNIACHDCDLGASGNVADLPNCVFHVAGMPHQITFDGSCTAQGGDHFAFGVINDARTGQGLNIYNLRYEQTTARDDAAKYAIDLTFRNRAMENLLLVGCRWTDRKAGVRIAYNPAYPLVPKITHQGCFLPGEK